MFKCFKICNNKHNKRLCYKWSDNSFFKYEIRNNIKDYCISNIRVFINNILLRKILEFEKRRDKKEEEEIRKSLKIDIKNEFKFYINDNKYLEEENLIKENILKIKLNELKEKNKILKSNFEELDNLLKELND